MNFINGWKSKVKQGDKYRVEVRVSFITIFKFYADLSDCSYELQLFNFGFKSKL